MEIPEERRTASQPDAVTAPAPNEVIERLAAFCEQTASDGFAPSFAWFKETAATLRWLRWFLTAPLVSDPNYAAFKARWREREPPAYLRPVAPSTSANAVEVLRDIVGLANDTVDGCGRRYTFDADSYLGKRARAVLVEALAPPAPKCLIGEYCHLHGFIHGIEAEELRARFEQLAADQNTPGFQRSRVRAILDDVDARDSAAFVSTPDGVKQRELPAPPRAKQPLILARGRTTGLSHVSVRDGAGVLAASDARRRRHRDAARANRVHVLVFHEALRPI